MVCVCVCKRVTADKHDTYQGWATNAWPNTTI